MLCSSRIKNNFQIKPWMMLCNSQNWRNVVSVIGLQVVWPSVFHVGYAFMHLCDHNQMVFFNCFLYFTQHCFKNQLHLKPDNWDKKAVFSFVCDTGWESVHLWQWHRRVAQRHYRIVWLTISNYMWSSDTEMKLFDGQYQHSTFKKRVSYLTI